MNGTGFEEVLDDLSELPEFDYLALAIGERDPVVVVWMLRLMAVVEPVVDSVGVEDWWRPVGADGSV